MDTVTRLHVRLYRSNEAPSVVIKARWSDVMSYLGYFDSLIRRVHVGLRGGDIYVDIVEA